MKFFKRSFSTRLSMAILVLTTIVFVVAFLVFYGFSRRTLENHARQKAEYQLEIINLEVEKVLRQVEKIPNNLSGFVAYASTPEQMFKITRRVLEENKLIYGSAIAMEPNYFKNEGYYFSAYSHHEKDSIRTIQLGNKDYDYFKWDWYERPKTLNQPSWSKPYFDELGGKILMCTYSAPIHDQNGKFIGVFTADISLEFLTDMLQKLWRNDNTYSFMIDEHGVYIAHYLKERILKESIFRVAKEMNSEAVTDIGDSMTAGKSGMMQFNNSGVESYAFFAPVPLSKWSVGVVITQKEVFADLYRINIIVICIVVMGLMALFVLCWSVVKRMTRPLITFANSAQAIAHGDFSMKLPQIETHDEMKELHDSFVYMQNELKEYIDNLEETTSAKEKIESELRIARDIQMSMIPKIFPPFPEREEIDLYAVLNPAKEVGGDLYDFFLNGDSLFFVIGDVSGKGVPASLLMAVTRSLFRSVSTNTQSPAEIVKSLNAAISEHNDANMFVTLFVGVLNLKTGEMDFCNAGHNPPIIRDKAGNIEFLKVFPNLPVGIIEGFDYKEQKSTLAPGSAITLYTDGVTEAENENEALYGEEKLLKVVELSKNTSAKNRVLNVLKDVSMHVGDCSPSDDITMLAINFRGQEHQNDAFSEIITLKNDINELLPLASKIEEIGEKLDLPHPLTLNINLAMEEVVSNIILYSYKDAPKDEEIVIDIEKRGKILKFVVSDSGPEFDPTKNEAPDITLSAEERSIGGLGIFLVKQMMDEVHYQRANSHNILVMTKFL